MDILIGIIVICVLIYLLYLTLTGKLYRRKEKIIAKKELETHDEIDHMVDDAINQLHKPNHKP